MFELHWPWVFVLAPLPLLMLRLPAVYLGRQGALRVPFFEQLKSLHGPVVSRRGRIHRVRLLLLGLVWLLLLGAASRPTHIGEAIELPTSGRDLMLAVDISGSMLQKDMVVDREPLPRVAVVKAVVRQFVQQRRGDRIGLILFGTRPYIQAPLTFDTDAVQSLMDEARVGFAGKATAIGDAIGYAVKRLRERPENSRVLIVLTDGADTASTLPPLKAAELAAAENIRIYTIGIGATEMEVSGLFGFGGQTVNPSADLDEKTLHGIAETTGGRYYRARDPRELQAAYRDIGELEPIEQDSEALRPERSLLHWPLAAAILVMLILALKVGGWQRPGRSPS